MGNALKMIVWIAVLLAGKGIGGILSLFVHMFAICAGQNPVLLPYMEQAAADPAISRLMNIFPNFPIVRHKNFQFVCDEIRQNRTKLQSVKLVGSRSCLARCFIHHEKHPCVQISSRWMLKEIQKKLSFLSK